MGRLLLTLLASCCLYILVLPVLSAQEADTSNSLPSREINTQPRPIEEITVIGQQSLARLRRLVKEKEEKIFAFFNANNSSDRMDIICGKRAPTGTFIMRRVCEPRFLKDLRSEMARGFRRGFNSFYSRRDLIYEAEPDFEKLQNEMLLVMVTNKDFAEMLVDLVDLSDNYGAHRAVLFPIDND